MVIQVDIVVDIPEEICDLNPQKTCHLATKMVPKLTPEHECTKVPQEVCQLSFGPPQVVSKPFKAEWCLDEAENSVENQNPREAKRGGRFRLNKRRFRGQNRPRNFHF